MAYRRMVGYRPLSLDVIPILSDFEPDFPNQ